MIDMQELFRHSNILFYQMFLKRGNGAEYEISRLETDAEFLVKQFSNEFLIRLLGIDACLDSDIDAAYKYYGLTSKPDDVIMIMAYSFEGSIIETDSFHLDIEKDFVNKIVSERCFHYVEISKRKTINVLTRFIGDDKDYVWNPSMFDELNKFVDNKVYVGRYTGKGEPYGDRNIIFKSPMYGKSLNDFPVEEVEAVIVEYNGGREYYKGKRTYNIHDIEIVGQPQPGTLVYFIYGLLEGTIECPSDWHLEYLSKTLGNPHKKLEWYN